LILDGWKRVKKGEGDSERDCIEFNIVRNVGSGSAISVLGLDFDSVNKPTNLSLIVTAEPIYILAAGEQHTFGGRVTIIWQHVEEAKLNQGTSKSIAATISILCVDLRRRRHQTRYRLLVWEKPDSIHGASMILPGVILADRTVSTHYIPFLQFKGFFVLTWHRLKKLALRKPSAPAQAK
jgi:hypothetical protein